jgi:DNA-binding NarL/FixJ family response regulator
VKKIRVVIADDHIYAAEGLEKIVSEAEDMDCVGSTTELLELPALVKHKSPDVLVLDIAWLGDKQAGIHILPDIHKIQPKLPVVMVTVYPELIEPARQAGAYPLSKGFSRHELLNAIRWAMRQADNSSDSQPAPVDLVPLTPAEQIVLGLLAKGLSDLQISKQLDRSEGTVKKHVSNILGKLGVRNRTEAAVMAERYNLVGKK